MIQIWSTFGAVLLTLLAVTTAPSQTQEFVGDAGLKEGLRLFEIDESVINFLRDGEDLSDDELESVYRLLYVLPRFDELQRHGWRRIPDEWQSIVATPEVHRLSLFDLTGRVVRVERRELPIEAARRFGFDAVYVIHVESTRDGRMLTICSPRIPERWPSDPRGQPVRCDAVFLKVGQGDDRQEELVFATHRVAWLPNQVTNDPLADSWALLGSYGMDVSRLEDVRQKTPLGDDDRECFYQLLWVMRRLPADQLARTARTTLPIVELLRDPAARLGQAFRLQGTARRAIRIRVDDPDIRERFGIENYYEIEVFTPLEQSLHLVDERDGQTRAYDKFPVTVICVELPPGMAEGDEIRVNIEADAVFMKLWSYRSEFATGGRADDALPRRQLSPLMLARTVRLTEPASTPNPWPAWSMAAMLFGSVLLALVARFWYARSDRPFQRWRSAQASVNEISFPDGDINPER